MPQQLFSDFSLLVRATLSEILENIEDPQRDLQDKIQTLTEAWETGRHELAEAGNALSVYQEKEESVRKQIAFHEEQAERFAANVDVAYAHLKKAKECGESLARAEKATAEYSAEIEKQRLTVDAVAERLETLQKAADKIKLVNGRAKQLDVLRKVADEEKEAEELGQSAVKILYVAEARLELDGIKAPSVSNERDPELLEKIKQLQARKSK